jgi:uncharacterized phage protein (TIGR02220 family)
MENNGWIKLYRKIMENDYWLSEPFTRAQAWIDLLLLANHTTGHIRKRGILIEVQRGQVGYSEKTLSARWKWSRGKVLRFLSQLKSRSQITRNPVQQNRNLSSLITIINYDLYQSYDTTSSTTDGQQTVQEQEGKERKEDIYRQNALQILSYLNDKTGKKYRTAKHIEARLKTGATVDDCKRVIDTKILDPYFIANPKYLNPETLFRPSNFDRYSNESPAPENQSSW